MGDEGILDGLCRDCGAAFGGDAPACPRCRGTRLRRHPELHELAVAHVDCDAFYASVEKRDDPTLRGRPVIVGGRHRGVVAACCYIARQYGVRSAMPMFRALELCPHAAVVPPDMPRYAEAGRRIRAMMEEMTPLVEPVSIDEAYMDLSGTQRLHGASPAQTLARLVRRIETEVGVTASIGLSYNKFLAKVASDLDKPRGFAVIGRAEAVAFLSDKPVGLIWGVGPALQKRLQADGIGTIGELRDVPVDVLMKRYGSVGWNLARFAQGQDSRKVAPREETKSISAETTFNRDLSDLAALEAQLRPLCGRVAERLGKHRLWGGSVVLKLKTADFRTATRSQRLDAPTQDEAAIWTAARALLEREADGRRFRLIGVGCAALTEHPEGAMPDLFGGPAT